MYYKYKIIATGPNKYYDSLVSDFYWAARFIHVPQLTINIFSHKYQSAHPKKEKKLYRKKFK